MKNNEHAPKVFLLGDSIIDNGRYVGNMPTVTDEVRKRWAGEVFLCAVDGDVIRSVELQYERAVANGFRPDVDVMAISVMGNDLMGYTHVLRAPVTTVSEAMGTIYATVAPIFQAYTQLISQLRAAGVKHLVLVTIYPVYSMDRIGHQNEIILGKPSAWIGMTPILGLVHRHIVDTAIAHGAQVADLFSGDFKPADIVLDIEPGPSASPKVASIIVDAAKRCVGMMN
jgi:hypothetical protein